MDAMQTKSHVDFAIEKDYTKACDAFGYSKVKEYASGYRDNAERVTVTRLPFYEWCKITEENQLGYTDAEAFKRMQHLFKPGRRVKLMYAQEKDSPSVGSKGTVVSVSKDGNVDVSWDDWNGSDYRKITTIKFAVDYVTPLNKKEIESETFQEEDRIEKRKVKCKEACECYTCGSEISVGETMQRYLFMSNRKYVHAYICSTCMKYIKAHDDYIGAKRYMLKFNRPGQVIECDLGISTIQANIFEKEACV